GFLLRQKRLLQRRHLRNPSTTNVLRADRTRPRKNGRGQCSERRRGVQCRQRGNVPSSRRSHMTFRGLGRQGEHLLVLIQGNAPKERCHRTVGVPAIVPFLRPRHLL